jgi:hypothetical protein
MADDAIRPLLADLPTLDVLRKPPGTVAISRAAIIEQIEDSDHELDEISAWVTAHGGRLVKPPPVQHQMNRGGRRQSRTEPADAYFVVPESALADARGQN